MNKLKLIYDVVKTMKDKDVFQGQVQVEVNKGQQSVFSLNKEFYKDCKSGEVKFNLKTEANHDGNKFKHHSETELQGDCCEKHHEFFKHLHQLHHGKCGSEQLGKHCGLKGKLDKILFILGLFNSMKVSEAEKGCVVSLNKDDIPEEMINAIHQKMGHKMTDCKDSCCCKLEGAELAEMNIEVFINKNSEIESINLAAGGKCKCSEAGEEKFDIKANINIV